ncbi:MAG: hypothetical protein NPINA01_06250 [Nitrospinaceae bacterium]|nr:MAG: hypothetical protein NPINA01_06250 [Nitrospinaceae bacterium]
MSESLKINIYGREYNVKSDSFSVDPHEVANVVDSKMQELSRVATKTSTTDLAILTALNIAQELLEIKNKTGENNRNAEKRIDELIGTLEKEVENLKL